MILFSAKDVSKTYTNHKALDKVSIEVEQGSIFGLLGPNGAGKTTLIRIINQITAPDEGEIFFMGEKLKADHVHSIGYLPEERGLYKKMKVGEQAIYLAELKGIKRADAKKRLEFWFEKFDILSWWNRKVEELSKGMQQKVQFVTTILHEPKLLIFDEPFSGFDPINTNLLKQEILELKKKGATIIFSTHNMESVEEICDSIALINKSRKILDGKVVDIKQKFKKNQYEVVIPSERDIRLYLTDGVTLINSINNPHTQVSTLEIEQGRNADLLSNIL
ncbi:MAG TPA: ATP-binding cassette domain-containing protein, partial [Bacteroidales bacterium]|nr:ATP-binding cassette domain-containing protein [Bacteroidales bacterium]